MASPRSASVADQPSFQDGRTSAVAARTKAEQEYACCDALLDAQPGTVHAELETMTKPAARAKSRATKKKSGDGASGRQNVGALVLLDLGSDTEEPASDEQHGSLAALSPLRAELMRGDLRPAYLAWLLAVEGDHVDEDAAEPPVPAGLTELTGAQEAMVEFLRIDIDLIAAAAGRSAAVTDDGAAFRRWLAARSDKEKNAWLRRAADEPDL